MKLRIAKQSDSKILADIHMECGKIQMDSFMHKLGKSFMYAYYKTSLKEKNFIILIAEDQNGVALGFNSGTLDAAEHIANLKKHRLSLAFATLPAIFRNPKIIKEVLLRNSFVSSNPKSNSFVINEGARGEYWAWRPDVKDPASSGLLRQAWINIIYEMGCRSFKYELDITNSNIERYCKIFGCKLLKEIILPDGRKRAFVEQSLIKTKIYKNL